MTSVNFGLQLGTTIQDNSGETLNNLVSLAALADDLGYHSVSTVEHHFGDVAEMPQPMVFLGGLATATENLHIGTNILILPLHHPVEVAEQAVILDHLSRGKFRLAVGLGWRPDEYAAFGVEKRIRAKYMEEGLEIVRKLLTEENVSYDGEIYSFDDVTVTPRPVQDEIPIWYGCQSPAAIRRVARMADAWLISNTESQDQIAEKLAIFKEELEKNDRSYDDLYHPMRREAYVAESDEQAWAEASEGIQAKYNRSYEGYSDVGLDFSLETTDEVKEFGEEKFIVGSPDTVIEEIETYRKLADVDEIFFQVRFPGLDFDLVEKSVRLMGEEVLPHFQDS